MDSKARREVPDPAAWTLEGDAKLLEYMQTISKNLENRCTKVSDDIGRLMCAADGVSVDLGNVTNKLNHLQQNQFVENRVQEEAEEVPVPVIEEKSKVTDVDATKKLLDESVQMLHKCYEKVSLDPSQDESDAEDDKLRFAYRPINPYEHKRRPYIIGTKEWLEKHHIGLQSSEDDDDEPESDEEVSETESHLTDAVAPPSHAPPPPDPVQYFVPPPLKLPPVSIPADKKNIPINASTDSSTFRDNSAHIVPNLFSDEPPEFDTVSEAPSKGPPNLFTESDDENQNIPATTKAPNLFFDEPPDEVDQQVATPKALKNDIFNQNLSRQIAAQAAAVVSRKPVSNLFEDDSEDEDFVTPKKQVVPRPPEVKTAPAKVPSSEIEYTLRRNLPAEQKAPPVPLFLPQLVKAPEPAKSPKVVEPPKTKKKVTNLFDDDSDDDDFFLPTSAKKAPEKSKEVEKAPSIVKAESPKPVQEVVKPQFKPEVQQEVKKPQPTSIISAIRKQRGLFDDEDEDEDSDDLFSPVSKEVVGGQRVDNQPIVAKKPVEVPQKPKEKEPVVPVPEKRPDSQFETKKSPPEVIQPSVKVLESPPKVTTLARDHQAPPKEEIFSSRDEKTPSTNEKAPSTVKEAPEKDEKASLRIEKASSIVKKATQEDNSASRVEKAPSKEEKAPSTLQKAPLNTEKSSLQESAREEENPRPVISSTAESFDSTENSDQSFESCSKPPPSDEFFSPTSTLMSESKSFSSIPSASLSYHNFFNDLPPDDDLGDVDESFNDDGFNDDIEEQPVNAVSDPYLIRDEPPDVMDDTKSFKEKFSMFQGQKQEAKSTPVQKPAPRKLNVNLNINVGALLPGAKRPPKPESPPPLNPLASPEEPKIKENVAVTPKVDPAPESTATPAAENSLLTSFTKSRASGPTRRPSTRKARHDNYRKSLVENVDAPDVPSKLMSIADMLKNAEQEPELKRKSLVFDDEEDDKGASDEESPEVVIKVPDLATKAPESAINAPATVLKATDLAPKERDLAPKAVESISKAPDLSSKAPDLSPKAPSLASKVTDLPPKMPEVKEDLKSSSKKSVEEPKVFEFTRKVTSKAPEPTPQEKTNEKFVNQGAIPKKSSPNRKVLLFEDEDGGDIFGEKKQKEPEKPKLQPPEPQKAKDREPKKSLPEESAKPRNQILKSSLFDDDDDSDDFDFLSTPSSKTSQKSAPPKASEPPVVEAKTPEVSKPATKPIPSQKKSIFGDDADDDDIFSAPAATKTQPAKKPVPVSGSSNLFGEDSDDDLFSKQTKVKPQAPVEVKSKAPVKPATRVPVDVGPKKPVVAKSKGLFDSDEDEEGDIFSSQTQPRKKVSLPKKTQGSLFGSDNEDDDDLFGGSSGSRGSKGARGAKISVQSAKQSSADPAKKSSVISSDPLADLLNQ